MTDEIVVNSEHFKSWVSYWGELHSFYDTINGEKVRTLVYGFENMSTARRGENTFVIPKLGACYGFVSHGRITIQDNEHVYSVKAGQYFGTPNGCTIMVEYPDETRAVVSQRVGFYGMRVVGGPIETRGRLRYIDRCSDTLLVPPPLLGDPCLNHLHFPPNIDQTEHFHPSIRSGIVARGEGWCQTPVGRSRLLKGVIFSIPTDGLHNFLTDEDQTMDVIAYHPDSDWGPTPENHPMVNRTWVDGTKVDNSTAEHLGAPVVDGYDPAHWPDF